MDYQSCGKMMKITEETKLVNVPAILFFTLEKFLLIVNKVKIFKDKFLDLKVIQSLS